MILIIYFVFLLPIYIRTQTTHALRPSGVVRDDAVQLARFAFRWIMKNKNIKTRVGCFEKYSIYCKFNKEKRG